MVSSLLTDQRLYYDQYDYPFKHNSRMTVDCTFKLDIQAICYPGDSLRFSMFRDKPKLRHNLGHSGTTWG